jgi:hypothetical protein
VRDTWNLIDLKLGAFVRGECLLILLVGTVLSLLFFAIGLPYWLLIGAFAGLVEIVPVIGPARRRRPRRRVGLTVDPYTALWRVSACSASGSPRTTSSSLGCSGTPSGSPFARARIGHRGRDPLRRLRR